VLRIVSNPISSPEARGLERQHSAEIMRRYDAEGEEPEAPLDPGQFEPPHGAFVVAYFEVDGGDLQAVGIGGIRRIDETTAELKRMFVAEEARGRGVGHALLERLEEEAVALGYSTIWLETGTPQFEAVSLYESHGYELIPSYGEYQHIPENRCFARTLVP
jgi:GNAT superfamily N-acetyltransferase